jgi:hypothetical protein
MTGEGKRVFQTGITQVMTLGTMAAHLAPIHAGSRLPVPRETNRQLRLMPPKVVDDALARMRQLGGVVTVNPTTDLLTVNHEFTTSLVISRCRQTEAGSFRRLFRRLSSI